jgi:hypothetical protein
MTTLQQLATWKQEALAPYYEAQSDRANRYYDCQDDTIMNGMSWNATQDKINSICYKADLMEEQIVKGCVTLNFMQSKLYDLNGNLIDAKIVCTQFGEAYVTNDGIFISCAKKQSTLNKKGYMVKTFEVTLKCQYSGKEKYDYKCIYKWRPVFDSIEETYVEVDFDGNHHNGIYWI